MRTADPALLDRVRLEVAGVPGEVTTGRVAAALRATGAVLGDEGLLETAEALRAELVGAGPLEPLLADPEVTDVMVNGAAGVWVDRGRGVERVRVDVGDESTVRALAARLAAAAGRRLDDAVPFVDARLPSGVRLHVLLPPLVDGGTHLCLRVPRRQVLSLTDLVRRGTVPPAWEPLLRDLVRSRCAFMVTGGTGVGKTTLLGALLGQAAPTERMVLVEDCAELRIDHPHVVRLQSRAANVEGRGAVTMTDLVRQALRMRPDRIVVGEVRGGEVRELLAALNTGHDGGCGTVHANDGAELPARLEALGALAGLDRDAVHAQVAGAFHAVVHLRRYGPLRRVVELGALDRSGPRVQVQPALVADPQDPADAGQRGPGWPLLAARLGPGWC